LAKSVVEMGGMDQIIESLDDFDPGVKVRKNKRISLLSPVLPQSI